MNTIIRWLLSAVTVILVTYLVPGITVANFWTALLVALALGLASAVLRPLLAILTLPITILTLGLSVLFINAGLFLLVAYVIPGFTVDSFWVAFLGAIVYAILGWAVNLIFGKPKTPLAPHA